jgi:hypothetical protein
MTKWHAINNFRDLSLLRIWEGLNVNLPVTLGRDKSPSLFQATTCYMQSTEQASIAVVLQICVLEVLG